MVNRQTNLCLKLAGMKSGEPVTFEILRHWIDLKDRVSKEKLEPAFQERWREAFETLELVLPGSDTLFPTAKVAPHVAAVADRSCELVLKIGIHNPVSLSSLNFLKAPQPLDFCNLKSAQRTRFFESQDRFLASASGANVESTFVVVDRSTGTHTALAFDQIKLEVRAHE